jgi:hypothetical protein
VSDRTSGDVYLKSLVDAETTERISGDTALNTDLDAVTVYSSENRTKITDVSGALN